MTTVLERYHRLESRSLSGLEVFTKPGVRGYPQLPPGAESLASADSGRGGCVDASGTAGIVALACIAAHSGGAVEGKPSHAPASQSTGGPSEDGQESLVVEPSMAALRCARRTLRGTGVEPNAGLPWDLERGSATTIVLAPPADKGSARVLAEVSAASHALTADGALYLALHKDLGAKRYLRGAGELFGRIHTISRRGGWRLVEAREPNREVEGGDNQQVGLSGFDLSGIRVEALPGVHSAGRLDRGTELLLASVPWPELEGADLLDLGCGSGALALRAAVAGARVTAVDDDLAAVRSTRHNARLNGLGVQAIHSDVDSELSAASFDVVVSNPPFHVGKGVRLAVPEAFLAGAHRLLRPGGTIWLVANRDLPYERMLDSWRHSQRVADAGGFKVLRARH